MKTRPDIEFRFSATGIGSIPSLDARETCLNILKLTPEIPFWPQLVKKSRLEDFFIQFSEGLPLLTIREGAGVLDVSPYGIETALTAFYERFLSEDLEYFKITRDYASGLYELLDIISEDPAGCGRFIKGHTIGPVTFVAGIKGSDGKSMLSNPDLREAYIKGIAIKALWQVRRLEQTGKSPIIFLDEPYLSGFGSAFSPIQRHEVIDMLKEVIDYLRERSNVLIGIHCCGNTDWSMLIETAPDIINFDAFGFMDYFLLYPDAISQFIYDGGFIAWGIVPTSEFTGAETVGELRLRLEKGLTVLKEIGLDTDLITRRSLLTPSCGMGTMDEASSNRVLELLSLLSKDMK
ncbi:MAG: hypothetical protein JW944_08880 [Deltaproteobacteria bacterium]|nr:hypothetical protein [Deltaproteobacteria bacterium]